MSDNNKNVLDISILNKQPDLTVKAVLTITPLAPLSMVESMPGSFYQTTKFPSKKMICGLFENLLGWHFGIKERKAILKDYDKLRKKNKLEKTENEEIGSTYNPLLMDYFQIEGQPDIDGLVKICFYTDLWNKAYRRADTVKHLNGCRNISYSVLKEKHILFNELENNTDLSGKDKDAKKDAWFKCNIDKVPTFYTTPTQREYIDFDGSYKYHLRIDYLFYKMIYSCIEQNNMCYLGNSEGWVDIRIEEEV